MKVIGGFTELCVAPKGYGKSYYLEGRARYLANASSVRAVLMIDHTNRVHARPGIDEFWTWQSYANQLEETGVWPRISVFHLGDDPLNYRPIFQHVLYWGRCALIVDEAWNYLPSGKREIPEAFTLAALARGAPDYDGYPQPCYMLLAAQSATADPGIAPSIRNNCDVVVCGKLRGASDRRWLRDVYGSNVLDNIDKCAPYKIGTSNKNQWYVVEPPGGKLPLRMAVPSF